ncbi:MAG TPA: hypothetical protein VIJ04_15405 [Xanthobacteraceae bacterium]
MIAPPLSLPWWEALRHLAEPFELMKFTLIYEGDLPASANSSKPVYVSQIRNAFHDQLADLWDSHIILRQLQRTARTRILVTGPPISAARPAPYTPAKLPDFKEPIPPLAPGQVDFCAPIQVPNSAAYLPLVRQSLHLACAVDILFLRHEDPGALVLQGGDIDGRIKTLFDALRMPSEAEEKAGGVPTADPLCCLLESDTLISDLSVKTGRLLGDRAKKHHTVRLSIDVTVKVLRVMSENLCLVGE